MITNWSTPFLTRNYPKQRPFLRKAGVLKASMQMLLITTLHVCHLMWRMCSKTSMTSVELGKRCIPGLSLSFEAAVACKLSAVAVKYMPDGHVPKAQKGLSI